MPEGGILTIVTGVNSEKTKVVIEISDTGIGIPSEILEKVCEPFFTTKPVGQGTGLGLSIGHGIIKNHDGELSIQSKPGKGTLVTIKLPVTIINRN